MEIYLSGPAIAHLLKLTLMTVNEKLRAGRYGLRIHEGRVAYAALSAVEQHEGRRFNHCEIAAAVGADDRIIIRPRDSAA